MRHKTSSLKVLQGEENVNRSHDSFTSMTVLVVNLCTEDSDLYADYFLFDLEALRVNRQLIIR